LCTQEKVLLKCHTFINKKIMADTMLGKTDTRAPEKCNKEK
jgi:hypothetical protein